MCLEVYAQEQGLVLTAWAKDRIMQAVPADVKKRVMPDHTARDPQLTEAVHRIEELEAKLAKEMVEPLQWVEDRKSLESHSCAYAKEGTPLGAFRSGHRATCAAKDPAAYGRGCDWPSSVASSCPFFAPRANHPSNRKG